MLRILTVPESVCVCRSVLDYSIHIDKLPEDKQNYVALTGNFSVAGFQLTLKRKVGNHLCCRNRELLRSWLPTYTQKKGRQSSVMM